MNIIVIITQCAHPPTDTETITQSLSDCHRHCHLSSLQRVTREMRHRAEKPLRHLRPSYRLGIEMCLYRLMSKLQSFIKVVLAYFFSIRGAPIQ